MAQNKTIVLITVETYQVGYEIGFADAINENAANCVFEVGLFADIFGIQLTWIEFLIQQELNLS